MRFRGEEETVFEADAEGTEEELDVDEDDDIPLWSDGLRDRADDGEEDCEGEEADDETEADGTKDMEGIIEWTEEEDEKEGGRGNTG